MVYKRETIKFWNWFKENNDKIKILIDDNDINSVNEFLKDAIIKVANNVSFEISKSDSKYKLELMCMGDQLTRVFILSLLVYVPKDELKEWEFYGYRTAKRGSLNIGNIELNGDDVRIFYKFNKKIGKFKVKVLSEKLNRLKEKDRISVMYLLLYEYIGEILTESLIGEVEFLSNFSYQIRYKNQVNCLLSDFREYLKGNLGCKKILQAEKNGLISEFFTGSPLTEEVGNRKDITQGHSALVDLNYEVYLDEKPVTKYLKNNGILPMYISVNTIDVSTINRIYDKLVKVISKNGIIIGSSVASQYTYIDFLWLDDSKEFKFSQENDRNILCSIKTF